MIVISDIHGRSFWEEAVRGHEEELIVFLGDYHDPYHFEFITKKESIENFKKIIEFKKEHMNNVILLIGNHDFHYLHSSGIGSRYDYSNAETLKKLFEDNIDLFQMTYYREFNAKKIVFSHAGIIKPWFNKLGENFSKMQAEEIADTINSLFKTNNVDFFGALCAVSKYRGGFDAYGSIIWADVDEHANTHYNLDDVYQVFGHTQQISDPIITDTYACLDCRRAFIIDEEGNIIDNKVKENE